MQDITKSMNCAHVQHHLKVTVPQLSLCPRRRKELQSNEFERFLETNHVRQGCLKKHTSAKLKSINDFSNTRKFACVKCKVVVFKLRFLHISQPLPIDKLTATKNLMPYKKAYSI